AMTNYLSLARDQLFDLAQLFLAKKHFLADEEGRRAERAALDGCLGILDQFRLRVSLLRSCQQLCGVEAGRVKRFDRDLWIVHFLGLSPHVMKGGVDIFREHALELRGYRRAHQVQRVDREERVPDIRLDLEALHKTLGLDRVKLALVLDAGQRFGWRFVVSGLEDAAEQDRHIFEFDADALLDRRDRLMAEIRVRAAEIEHE